jgi:uncharacterized protein (DUF2236 family)
MPGVWLMDSHHGLRLRPPRLTRHTAARADEQARYNVSIRSQASVIPSSLVPPRNPVSRKIHAERVLLLGWGRALLLQFAHPLVAQGIAEHSGFLRHRRGRWSRLRRTLDAMLVLTFGTPDEAAAVARGINAIHDRVHGPIASPLAAAPARTYSAHDPELLRWVHATLVDSFMRTYELYVAPLSAAEKEEYCTESAGIEPLLGIPPGFLPRSMRELECYMQAMLVGPGLMVSEPARRLARELLTPVPWIALPLVALARLPTVGLLPEKLRAEYGLAWSTRHEAVLGVSARAIRMLLRVIPLPIRQWRVSPFVPPWEGMP